MNVKALIDKNNSDNDPGSVESAASNSTDSDYLPEEEKIQPKDEKLSSKEEKLNSKELSLILTSGMDQIL